MTHKHWTLGFLALAAIFGLVTTASIYAPELAEGETDPVVEDLAAERVEKTEPKLCDLDPSLCEPCGITSECPTPASSGWLCCNPAGICTPTTVDGSCKCAGCILGYCANYTQDPASGNCTCHDTPSP